MDKNVNYEYISGINPVYSLITRNAGNRKIYEIILNLSRKKDSKIQNILTEARKKNIEIVELESARFNSISPENINSQGVCARVSSYNYCNLDEYLNKKTDSESKLIVLDGVTDIGNFGSIIRNCNAFDFEGIIIPKRRSAALNERVSRISAGALEEIKIFRVVNIVRTLKELKNKGFWIYGTTLDITPEVKYFNEVNFTLPLALVLGSEDKGMSRLVSASCDIIISIKLSGRMQSLNVSVASGIILYKVQEQIEREN
ncbi:MAG: 23S rRNA (guanosine(2251)-2'-O)-methyltransferase RlmB [Actinobacteria bacterium]|nr:23S rRNA (guanosine(2251)-2'-O)-methyltransferase RlmB [Actinomycetota bacterium]